MSSNTNYSYADNDEFSFEKTKDNLTAVVDNFNSYISNVAHANESVVEEINHDDTCAINSPTLGKWLGALWEANTTYADSFKNNFVEWSNVVQHIMLHTSQMNDEAMSLFDTFDGVSELTFSFYGNKGAGVSITDASSATNARRAWEDFQHEWFHDHYSKDNSYTGQGFFNFFTHANSDEKQAIYDRALGDLKSSVGYFYQYGGSGKPHFDTTTWNPVSAVLGEYWNKNGKMPEDNEVQKIIVEMENSILRPKDDNKTNGYLE